MTHLGKALSIAPPLKVSAIAALAIAVAGTGCLGPSSAEKPEVELVEPQEQTRMATSVKREGGKVWIDGVPTLSWKKDGQCTYAGALAAALEVTEHPYSYSEIMGFSGLAFRVRWYQNDTGTAWCPSSPVGEFPEPIAATEQATGWRFRGVVLLGEKEPHMEQFAPDIVAAIDSGRPVLAYEPRLNMAVIYGYEGGGETVLLRDYFTGETPLELPTAKLGAMLLFLTEPGDPLPRREALVTALESAVSNWHRGRAANDDGSWYCYGEDALTAWKKDLGTVTILSDEQKGNLCFVSWWNFVSLHDARRNAVSFLRKSAPLLDGDAARALVRAAELYHEEAELLGSALANKDAFLNSVEDWTPEVQQREREILAQAREKEAAAIAEIEKALAAEGLEVVITAAAPGSTAHSSNPGGGAGAGGELAERRYDLSGLPGASPLQRRRDDERLPEPLANLLVDEAETGIVGLIEMVTGEKVWEVGHVSQEGSTLTVTNTAEVHDQVAEVLDTLRARPNLAVRVELRFIAADPAWRDKWPRLSDATRLLPVGASAKGPTATIISPDEERALITFVEATDSMTLSNPLRTVYNGQLAYVAIGQTKVLALQGRAAPPQPVWSGQVVEFRPFVEKDLKSICLWLNAANSRVHDVERTRADGTVEKVPEVSITQLVTTLAGPDGSAFLISLGPIAQEAEQGGEGRELRELLLVVKTKALIEDEAEVNLPELRKP